MLLSRDDWSADVKNAVNDMLVKYGKNSECYNKNAYAVFDFDNTCTVFDCEEQLAIFQIEVMAFEIKPENFKEILLTDLSDETADLSAYGYFNGSYNDIIDDIVLAYSELWKEFGPFNAKGVSSEKLNILHENIYWREFSAKLRLLYDLVYDVESATIAYPWILYWFTGMTEQEVYDLGLRCATKFRDVETKQVLWESPSELKSKAGKLSYSWMSGVSAAENIRELWQALDENGIDVWVCSASCTGAVRANIDAFGLHKYLTGMLGMTNKTDESGRYLNAYDYENGVGFYADENGWSVMEKPTCAQTFANGKVISISNAIAPEYDNNGPIAGFMDSSGDFGFCTEYKTLKLVICFNRATRKVTDGGGLISELAIYQRDCLGYDFANADKSGDTLYVLQGRDENGKRTLRNSNSTLRFGADKELLFANEENDIQLEYIKRNKMTTAQVINELSLKKEADESGLGFKTGFLGSYSGYHSHE